MRIHELRKPNTKIVLRKLKPTAETKAETQQ